jgi:Ca2+-dependent lipid-binding protein
MDDIDLLDTPHDDFLLTPEPRITIKDASSLGVLRLYIKEGKFTKDIELLTKMDPFVTMNLREEFWQSAVCEEGGKRPKWDDCSHDWSIKYMGDDFMIEVRDDDVFGSKLIGKTIAKVSTFVT